MQIADIFLHGTTWEFLIEIFIRCCVMFLIIITFLRLSGKRGIRQLSIFEVAIILSLGSAAGDPMIMEDVPIVHALTAMIVILLLYRLVTWSMMKSKKIEQLLEGKPLYIVEQGRFVTQDLNKEKYSHDEFFAELRQQNVEHLGQVKTALLETDGCLSILFYQPEDTKWGLPLFPHDYKKVYQIEENTVYACMYCGTCEQKIFKHDDICLRCKGADWTRAFKTIR